MRNLFIAQLSGNKYSSDANYCYIMPSNTIIQCAGIVVPGSTQSGPSLGHFISDIEMIFLEMGFDPITSIKRGKFYKKSPGPQPITLYRHQGENILKLSGGNTPPFDSPIECFKFESYYPSRNRELNKIVFQLGSDNLKTTWQVINVDHVVENEEVYVLRPTRTIGIIPSLNEQAMPQKYFEEIQSEYSAMLADLNSFPESIIDHCRDVAVSLLSAKLNLENFDRKDLGALIKQLPEGSVLLNSCSAIVNRLHPRRKPSEKEKLNLRQLDHFDSDFSVQCIFQIIRELGWAK